MKLLEFYLNDDNTGRYATVVMEVEGRKYPIRTEIDVSDKEFNKLNEKLVKLYKDQFVK